MREKLIRMAGRIRAMKENIKVLVVAFLISYMLYPANVYASGGSGGSGGSYTTAITNLKSVLLTIVVPAGAIVLIFGVIRFAIAFQKMDQNGEHQAVYTIIAGGVLIGASAIVSALS